VVDDAFQLSISSYTRKPGTYPFKPAVIGVSTHDAVTSQYIGYTAPTAAWNDPKGAVTLKTTGTNTIFQFDYTLNKDSVHVTGTFDCSAQTGLAGNGAGLGNLK